MPQIICDHLSLGYEHQPIVQELSFTVNAGDYLCILGENGSGKSTLMKTMLGLIPPLDGSIRFSDGMTVRDIGYLPQQTQVQKDFPASVWEIVLSGFLGRCGLHPRYSPAEKDMAIANLERLGITNLKERCYRELSGGQQQRVLLARALCAAQKCLLLDEPVTGLDPNATEEMYELIEELNRDGITVIMISHDTGAAMRYASHILQISQRCFFGSRQQYMIQRRPYHGR